MTGAAEFPYPGDDPGELISVSSAFYNAQGRVDSVSRSLGEARSSLSANWTSDAATAAGADLGKLGTALSEASTHLGNAGSAVDAYQGDLVKIRSQVDDLRTALTRLETVLSGQQTEYSRADRFGEINKMDKTQIASYRGGIATAEAGTHHQIRHLHDEYAALVRRANIATATCREALNVSIHGAQYNGSTITTVGLGPALGLGNLTMLAAWETAIEKNPPAFPKGKTPAETAALVAAYWASLPPEVREAFMHNFPQDVGNVDGVPIVDRSTANVIRATADKTRMEGILRRLGYPPDVLDPSSDDYKKFIKPHNGATARIYQALWAAGLKESDVQLYTNAVKCLNTLKNYPAATHGAPAYLMTYDPGAYNGDGRAAVCIGDPDTADNTALCVPGLNQTTTSYIGNADATRLYNQMRSSDPTHTQAVIQWMGYDAPGFSNVASENAAKHGAVLLAAAVAGLRATHDPGASHLTVIAHSYGSTTAADACVLDGMRPDDLVLIGSPGTGHAHTAADLGLPPGHVYVGSASKDPVTEDFAKLGTDPASASFGATRFHADATDRGSGPWYSDNLDEHSKYYATQGPHSPIPSESLQNISDVATGHGDKIRHDGELAPGRYTAQVKTHSGHGHPTTRIVIDPDSNYQPHWGDPTS